MKSWYKCLVYLSLVFLIVALYEADYLRLPHICSTSMFIGSLVFLFAGFISQTLCWKQVVNKSDYRVAFRECIAGMGLSVFGKYMPGKIWTIVGRAAYIAGRNHYALAALSALSLNAQFIALWVGLSIGALGLFLLEGLYLWGSFILCLWLGITIVIFSKLVHEIIEHLIKTMLRKDIQIPKLAIKSTLLIMPWYAICWACWSLGFYMLAKSLTESDITWSVGLGFPLAASLGIMAFIAPGGLGAREGVLGGYLALAGVSSVEATTIAIVSRLWFLIGEVFIFTLGWLVDKWLHKAPSQTRREQDTN